MLTKKAHYAPRAHACALTRARTGGGGPTHSHTQGSHHGFVRGNALVTLWPGDQGAAAPALPVALAQLTGPPATATHPRASFPRPHGTPSIIIFSETVLSRLRVAIAQCKERGNNIKLKSQNTQRIACFASRKLLALSPEPSSHTQIIASRSRRAVSLTAPAQTCPAGPRSGPPSHSPPAAAPGGRSPRTAWRSGPAGAWQRAGGPGPC